MEKSTEPLPEERKRQGVCALRQQSTVRILFGIADFFVYPHDCVRLSQGGFCPEIPEKYHTVYPYTRTQLMKYHPEEADISFGGGYRDYCFSNRVPEW